MAACSLFEESPANSSGELPSGASEEGVMKRAT